MIEPFPEYEGLLADKPDIEGRSKVVECEWEQLYFPEEFWPSRGDTIWTLGRWVFDCGHPEHEDVPGKSYHTEIHPPKAIAFSRPIAHTFRGDIVPSIATQTVMYFHGQGGYFYDPIGGQDYKFRVALPPKPSPTAVLKYEVVSVPLGGIRPILTPVPTANSGVLKNEAVKQGSTRDAYIPKPSTPGVPGGFIDVTFPLKNFRDPHPVRWDLYKDPRSARPTVAMPRFAAIIAAGWSEPTTTVGYRTLRITLDNFLVKDEHEVGPSDVPLLGKVVKENGEWFLWVNVNGAWAKLGGPGEISIEKGDTYTVDPRKDKKTFLITIAETDNFTIETTGFEQDKIDDVFGVNSGIGADGKFDFNIPVTQLPKVKDENQELGRVRNGFSARENFGIGAHDDRSNKGDFHLRYRIEEVTRIRPGTANSRR